MLHYAVCYLDHFYVNTYHAAGMSRRQVKKKKRKNVNILECYYHIWNHHEKCIQKSTNMSGIGSLIREISEV